MTSIKSEFRIGDRVTKPKGYAYPGIVVSVFETTAGQVRYVVECVAAGVEGMLHIFNAEQLQLADEERHAGQ